MYGIYSTTHTPKRATATMCDAVQLLRTRKMARELSTQHKKKATRAHNKSHNKSPGADRDRSSMNQRKGPASSESTPASSPASDVQLSCGLVHQDGASCCGKWCVATSECSACGTGNDMKLATNGRGSARGDGGHAQTTLISRLHFSHRPGRTDVHIVQQWKGVRQGVAPWGFTNILSTCTTVFARSHLTSATEVGLIRVP